MDGAEGGKLIGHALCGEQELHTTLSERGHQPIKALRCPASDVICRLASYTSCRTQTELAQSIQTDSQRARAQYQPSHQQTQTLRFKYCSSLNLREDNKSCTSTRIRLALRLRLGLGLGPIGALMFLP